GCDPRHAARHSRLWAGEGGGGCSRKGPGGGDAGGAWQGQVGHGGSGLTPQTQPCDFHVAVRNLLLHSFLPVRCSFSASCAGPSARSRWVIRANSRGGISIGTVISLPSAIERATTCCEMIVAPAPASTAWRIASLVGSVRNTCNSSNGTPFAAAKFSRASRVPEPRSRTIQRTERRSARTRRAESGCACAPTTITSL